MIYFNFTLRNPFSKNKFRAYKSWGGSITKNKSWEFEIYKHSYTLIGLEVDAKFTGDDHAGFLLSLNILGIEISFNIYDNRHWDDITNNWSKL